jgi:hypothetical protein
MEMTEQSDGLNNNKDGESRAGVDNFAGSSFSAQRMMLRFQLQLMEFPRPVVSTLDVPSWSRHRKI